MRRTITILSVLLVVGCQAARKADSSPAGTKYVEVQDVPIVDMGEETRLRRKGFENAPFVGVVSIEQLLADPQKYHGKKVLIEGYAVLEFESHGLLPSNCERFEGVGGIWLEKDFGHLPNDPRPRVFKHVIAEGVFDSECKGHMGLWGGGLCMVTRFEPISE